MPLMKCEVNGESGWKYGESGKCYTGDDAKEKATEQMQAIQVNKSLEIFNEEQSKLHTTYVANLINQIKDAWAEGMWLTEHRVLDLKYHNLFFESLGKNGEPSETIMKDFRETWEGSQERFMNEMKARAMDTDDDWLVMYFSYSSGLIDYTTCTRRMYGDERKILCVIDLCEHAYLLEFGLDRKKYLDHIFDNLNWSKINERREEVLVKKSNNVYIAKTAESDDENLVFGWANVSIDIDGEFPVDYDGHVAEPEVLEKSAYDFVLKFRDMGERHEGEANGTLVESVVFTKEKMAAMGIPEGYVPEGWWIGFHVEDSEVFQKIKDGDYNMFSIQGSALTVPIEQGGEEDE